MATTTPAWMIRAAEVWLLAAAVAAATSPADSTAGPSGNDNTGINGAEFSNNFISDLSPLLALFGERFAQQFMSFSTSWIDSLLFAVAPLGIITAIVSAVRVGGPSWLRTLVGRARETRAAAEVELMSSTSHEVCEIWNGDAIVRVMGTPEIVELLYFENLPIGWNSKEQQAGQSTMPDNDPQPNNGITGEQGNITGTEECEIFTLEEAIFRKLVIKVNRTAYFHNFLPWPFKQNPDQDKNSVHESSSTQPPPGDEPSDIERGPSGASTTNPDSNGGKLLDAYEMSTPDTLFNNYKAPNISLNLSVSRNTRELYIAAIFGILVQITVLVVAGLVSYHPGLKLTKGGTSVQEYAYPLTSGGTLLLVLGMFICASVVEQSTTEKTFKKADGIKKAKLYILWLQRGQLIGDQTFESYAMVAEEPAEEIWTSSRQRSREELPVSPFTSASATLGTVISISGFVLQFLGLRGSHWVVSLAQLAATMLMTAVRALIRRGMSKQPSTVRLAKDFELEWLASAMSKDRNNFGNNYSSLRDEKRKDHHWTTQKWAKTPQLNRCMQKFLKKFKTDDRKDPKVYLSPTLRVLTGGKSINSDNAVLHDARPVLPDARSFIHIRQRLGLLTQWSNPASDAAVSVADSMELVLNTLLPSNAEPFKWGISVSVDGNPQRVVMTVKRDAGIFRVGLAEIEALLSLWLQHAHLREQRDKEKEIMRKQEDRKSKSEESKSTRYSNRLKRENFKQNLWILGKDNHLLQQDLSWWLPKIDDTRVLCIGKGTEMDCYATDSKPKESHHRIDYHRIIGFGGAEGAMPGRECFAVDFECPAVSFDEQDGGTPDQSKPRYTDDSDTENGHFLAVMSNTQRELLFAQHIFAAFMSAVATEIPRIGGFTEASHSMTNLPTAWEHYQLKNEVLSKLASGISNTGLGSPRDALLCIIPPLSIADKLPVYTAVDEVVRCLEGDENVGNWRKCTEVYLDLLGFVNRFPSCSSFFVTRTAVASIVYLRRMTDARKVFKKTEHEAELKDNLSKLQKSFSQLLGMNSDLKEHLTDSFRLQNRWNDYRPFMDDAKPNTGNYYVHYPAFARPHVVARDCMEDRFARLQATGHFSHLHETVCRDKSCTPTQRHPEIKQGDILGWTPLHYAVLMKNKENVIALLNAGANAKVKDYSGWSPLHVAASLGYCDIGQMLLQVSDNVIAQDGSTPLHIATRHRQFNFAKMLITGGVSLRVSDSAHRTPLHWACVSATREDDIKLVTNGSDLGAGDILRATPLHLLCLNNADIPCKDLLKRSFVEAKDKSGHTPLMNASMTGCRKLVEALLHEEVNKEALNDNQQTALHLAVLNGREDVVKYLLDEKVNIHALDCNHANSLHLAATLHTLVSYRIAKMLVEKRIDTMHRNAEDLTPLNLAVRHGNNQIVELLLENTFSNEIYEYEDMDLYREFRSNQQWCLDNQLNDMLGLLQAKTKIDIERIVSDADDKGNTQLHLAVKEEQLELVKFLLGDKADVNKVNHNGYTSLHLAARKRNLAICSMLLEHGADVNLKCPDFYDDDDDDGYTALHTLLHAAAWELPIEFLELFLQNKAEIDIQNDDGITALGMAARYGYEDKTRLLLEKEADPNLRNKFGETVLEIACTGNGFVGAQLLIEAGAVVEPDKEYAGILLAEAEYQDDKKLVELIARACPDQLLYDSALHAATRSGYHIETIRRLLDAGGSPHWKDEYGWSAFDLAVSFRRDDLVSLLQTVSPPAASNLDATISTTRQESKMQWRKRQIWQSNNLNITDLEVEYVDNGYIDELVQGSRPFSLSHTLDSSDSLLLGDDDPPTASSPRDNKPEIYFEITILMKQSHWNCGLGLTNGRIQRLNEMADWDENAYYMEDNKYHKGHESWSYLTFRTGDTVGCGVIKGRLFFTKNGRHLDFEDNIFGVYGQFFPIVRIYPGSKIRANFGDEPFKWPDNEEEAQ